MFKCCVINIIQLHYNPFNQSHLQKKEAPGPGFEHGSEPRQGSMIGLYTIRTLWSL